MIWHQVRYLIWYQLGTCVHHLKTEITASMAELLEQAKSAGKPLHEVLMENEVALHGDAATREFITRIKTVMFNCIDRGMRTDGMLTGGLKVNRRAKAIA